MPGEARQGLARGLALELGLVAAAMVLVFALGALVERLLRRPRVAPMPPADAAGLTGAPTPAVPQSPVHTLAAGAEGEQEDR